MVDPGKKKKRKNGKDKKFPSMVQKKKKNCQVHRNWSSQVLSLSQLHTSIWQPVPLAHEEEQTHQINDAGKILTFFLINFAQQIKNLFSLSLSTIYKHYIWLQCWLFYFFICKYITNCRKNMKEIGD